jgi:hypothetical protein
MSSAGQGLEVMLGRASAPEARLDDDGVPGGVATASRGGGKTRRVANVQHGALNIHRPVHCATHRGSTRSTAHRGRTPPLPAVRWQPVRPVRRDPQPARSARGGGLQGSLGARGALGRRVARKPRAAVAVVRHARRAGVVARPGSGAAFSD